MMSLADSSTFSCQLWNFKGISNNVITIKQTQFCLWSDQIHSNTANGNSVQEKINFQKLGEYLQFLPLDK